jgi:hypothetical protein
VTENIGAPNRIRTSVLALRGRSEGYSPPRRTALVKPDYLRDDHPMAAKDTKSPARGRAKRGEIRLRGKRIPALDNELALVRTGSPGKGRVATRRSDEADVMVRKVGRALSKPGIRRGAIFQGRVAGKIFAYSVDPFDATRVVREAADGTRRVGRVVGGKFKLT